ncbi:AfsR/SARP family transcriptional regulator [Streptomyces sp. NBC_01483]|uniref:AfsR/SARP family transcriptional regulator n=1 Tax=Streptomyces sp. NBC_01483 TaxID=2903883 RepID=UPI002E353510|nr:BTAD domain-containing putative transcriptional regulator [Streptomyces sp. NBC_01483]
MSEHFWFTVLGPVRALRESTEIDLGSPQQRAVLVTLLLRENGQASIDELIQAVWGTTAPRSAGQTIRTYIYRLRKILEPVHHADASIIVSMGNGYALRVAPDQLDLSVFRQQVASADVAFEEGNPTVAVAHLRDALALWYGDPLAGIPGPYAVSHRAHLEALRLAAVERRINAECELGRFGEATVELLNLVAKYPLNERFREMLMFALCKSGRQAEALAVYREVRTLLSDELAIEPSARLRALHERVLRADPELLVSDVFPDSAASPGAPERPTDTGPAVSPGQVPSLLPADLPAFVGREDEFAQIEALLVADRQDATTMAISAIVGMAGVGKTAFAVHWAHRIAHRFPDGQIYLNLRGFDPSAPAMTPTEAFESILPSLGVASSLLPAHLDAQTALYRTLIVGRRILLLLDNARDAEQIRPLLPTASGSLVVVTSRNQLSSLIAIDGAHPIRIDVLSVAQATRFLIRRIGEERPAAEPEAVEEIIKYCGGLPIALAMVAARAASHPTFRLAAIAAELRAAHGSLDAFSDTDPSTDARAVFSCSYHVLSPSVARLFRLLSLHPGPHIGVAAATALGGLPLQQTRLLLADLVRAHLLNEPTPGRYCYHDLLRVYATELADAEESARERDAAVHRMFDHYVHTGIAASRLLSPNGEPVGLCASFSDSNPEGLADYEQASAWFTAEHQTLLAVIAQSAARRADTQTWQLAWVIRHFLYLGGHQRQLLATQELALEAAQRLSDRVAQAHAHLGLVRAEAQLGRFDEAQAQANQAIQLFAKTGDASARAETHRELSWVLELQGDFGTALFHARQAFHLHHIMGDRSKRALALNAVGWYHALLGQSEQALAYCRQALPELKDVGHDFGQANTWDTLGYALHGLGQHSEAMTSYQRALDLYRKLGACNAEASTLTRLGDIHLATGQVDAARSAWVRALSFFDGLDNSDNAERRETLAKLRDLDSEFDVHEPTAIGAG